MLRRYLLAIEVVFLGSGLLPPCIVVCTRLAMGDAILEPLFLFKLAVIVVTLVLCWLGFRFARKRLEQPLCDVAEQQARLLDTFPQAYVPLAIAGSACLSLLLELAVIRWHTTVFALFALYKNFGLLACFAGLGLGYALAQRKHIPLFAAIPLVFWQVVLLLFLRYGLGDLRLRSIMVSPVLEQANMSFGTATGLANFVPVYLLLSVVFLLSALAFVPVGQLCGRVMARRPNLKAYGLNLAGSLAGIGLMLALSYGRTAPAVWFGLCFVPLIAFQWLGARLVAGSTAAALLSVAALALPLPIGVARTYSPYQIIHYRTDPILEVKAAGLFYQRAIDLSEENMRLIDSDYFRIMKRYYELPYAFRPDPDDVAVMGAGTGNDVAAALRRGAGKVFAVDIDPVLIGLGRKYHPERPYEDTRVDTVVDDARTFLRQTDAAFDVVNYGLVDSYSVLSHSSSVRLDSFVYTVEGLCDARSRLKDDGIVCLTFAGLTPELDAKLYGMMVEAFEGAGPLCLRSGGYPMVSFLQNKAGTLALPPALLGDDKFEDITAECAAMAANIDLATDDWPFFYMPRRVYPFSYLGMLGLAVGITLLLVLALSKGGLRRDMLAFFFLGAGFMLVETKGITELGLAFGNTWHVIGIVIAGILFMAFLANLVVDRFRLKSLALPFTLLLASLAIGFFISKAGGFPPTPLGRLATVVVLTFPLFFSGIAFSTLLRFAPAVAGAMAMNVLGAMGGGLLEYNAMYFGFRFLYLLAGVLYVAAFLSAYLLPRSRNE